MDRSEIVDGKPMTLPAGSDCVAFIGASGKFDLKPVEAKK